MQNRQNRKRHEWTADEHEYLRLCVEQRGDQTKADVFQRVADEMGLTERSVASQYYLQNPVGKEKPLPTNTRTAVDAFNPDVFMGQLKALLDTYYSIDAQRVAELEAEYNLLKELVDTWISTGAVSKLTAMKDFDRRLKVQVDRFGQVIKVIKQEGDDV